MISRFARLAAVCVLTLTVNRADAQFVLGVNLFGDAVTIDGNLWQSETAASGNGFSFATAGAFLPFTYSAAPVPAVDGDTTSMLQGVRYIPFGNPPVTIHQTVPSGQAYVVELWTYEGFSGFGRSADISGDVASTNFGLLPLGGWEARSLTTGVINDGSIDFTITTNSNQPVLSGFAIYSAVPEPAGISLAIAGLAMLVHRRRTPRG